MRDDLYFRFQHLVNRTRDPCAESTNIDKLLMVGERVCDRWEVGDVLYCRMRDVYLVHDYVED